MRRNAYLRLIRPPALLTAAGGSVAGYLLMKPAEAAVDFGTLFLLAGTSVFFYAAGVVFNDCCDFVSGHDRISQRPLTQAEVPLKSAMVFALVLALAGLFCAFFIGLHTVVYAVFIICAALLYDSYLKSSPIAGSVNMGFCRALNMIMGMSAVTGYANSLWGAMSVFPLILGTHVFLVTLISTTEDERERGGFLLLAQGGFLLLLILEIWLAPKTNILGQVVSIVIFSFIFVCLSYLLRKSIMGHNADDIKKTVSCGVVSIMLINSAFIFAAGYPIAGLVIGLLVLPAPFLAKKYPH